AAQVRQAAGDAVAVALLVAGGLAELVDDLLVGHVGRVAHAEVDDVDAGAALGVLHGVDLAEEVRRQALDAVGHVGLGALLRDVRFVLHGSLVVEEEVLAKAQRRKEKTRRASSPLPLRLCALARTLFLEGLTASAASRASPAPRRSAPRSSRRPCGGCPPPP